MGSTTRLPALETVRKWTTKDLTEWLKVSNLGDCIRTFQERNIDGATLLETPYDKIITDLSDVKIKQRMQVAKCVTECKSQAAEAKKVVSSLKRSKKKRAQVAAGSAGEPDDFDSGDDWSSDEFDTDEEEEEKDYPNTINEDGFSASDFASDNISSNGPESVASSDSSGQYNDVQLELTMPGRTGVWNVKGPPNGRELDTATPEPSVVLKSVSLLHTDGPPVASPPTVAPKPTRSPIPKPPSAAPQLIGQLACTNSKNLGNSNVVHRRSVPKLQRPPSQPPAPPLPKNKMEPETPGSAEEEDCWHYEIPNSGIPSQQCVSAQTAPGQALVKVLPAAPLRLPPLHLVPNGGARHWNHTRRSLEDSGSLSPNDTYEPVDKPSEEETYEVVDDARQKSQADVSPGPTPCLPPRKPASLPPHLLMVPPLPEKPSKMTSPPLLQSTPLNHVPDVTPALPSKGLSSSKSFTQLVKEFRSKLGGRRESNISAKDVEVAVLQHTESFSSASSPAHASTNGGVTVTVNGSSAPTSCLLVEPSPAPPPPPPLPPPPLVHPASPVSDWSGPRHIAQQQHAQINADESSFMTLRPLPPVPSSHDKIEERLDFLPYYMDLERDEAEQRLLALHEEDAYLVRPSRRGGLDKPYTLTLIHKGRAFHLNIRLREDGRYALGRKKGNEMVFASVSALISHHQHHPIYLSAHGENVGTSLLRKHL